GWHLRHHYHYYGAGPEETGEGKLRGVGPAVACLGGLYCQLLADRHRMGKPPLSPEECDPLQSEADLGQFRAYVRGLADPFSHGMDSRIRVGAAAGGAVCLCVLFVES